MKINRLHSFFCAAVLLLVVVGSDRVLASPYLECEIVLDRDVHQVLMSRFLDEYENISNKKQAEVVPLLSDIIIADCGIFYLVDERPKAGVFGERVIWLLADEPWRLMGSVAP